MFTRQIVHTKRNHMEKGSNGMTYDRLRRELSYVQGLVEGSQSDKVEHKILQRLIDVVDELIETTQRLDGRQHELEEYVEAVDEDLNDLELLIYDDEVEDYDDGFLEIICPECGEEVLLDVDDLEDDTIEQLCPKCHTLLVVEDVPDGEFEEKELEEVGHS